jgi:hypothetical protein
VAGQPGLAGFGLSVAAVEDFPAEGAEGVVEAVAVAVSSEAVEIAAAVAPVAAGDFNLHPYETGSLYKGR